MQRPNARATREGPAGFQTSALVIFAVALCVRLLHVWQMRDTLFFSVLMGDSRGYDAWARQLAAGDWIGADVFYQAPLYPYFLGAIYAALGRDLLAVRVIQAVIGALSATALGYAGWRLISPAAGLIAGLMLALYPPAIFFDGLLQKSVLDVLFVCTSLAIVGHLIARGGGVRSWVLLGATLGALSLTRENALALVAVVLVWAASPAAEGEASTPNRAGRWTGVRAAAVVAGLAIVLMPVAIRNYAVGGGFYLTTSQFGSNLFIGNNPLADGSYMSLRAGRGSPEFERLDATELAEQASGRRLTPAEVSSYWTGRTLTFIRDQPAAWLRLLARKMRLLWSRTEVIDTESQDSHAEYSAPLRLLDPIWNFGVLLPLAVIGVVALWPQRRRLWPLYALTFVYAASVVLFFVVARYRHPLVPFVMLFAAAGVVGARAMWLSAGARRLVPLAVVLLLMTTVAFWPTETAAERRAITENNLGTALQEEGRPAEAVERYQRALAFDASYAPALNNLGTALRAAGRVDEAVKVFGQALDRDADAASVHYNLGNALMAQGKPAEAAGEFQQALQANPRSVDALNNLGMAFAAQGRIDDAIEAFRRASLTDPRSAVAFANLGRALATRGATREASAAFEQSIALAPANAETHYDLGSLLLESGNLGPATTVLREAVRLKPDYAEAHNNLGIALASQGQMADAIREWKEALRIKPYFQDAKVNLSKAGQGR
jgi:tetratricopeptide (TPR) repeat protein